MNHHSNIETFSSHLCINTQSIVRPIFTAVYTYWEDSGSVSACRFLSQQIKDQQQKLKPHKHTVMLLLQYLHLDFFTHSHLVWYSAKPAYFKSLSNHAIPWKELNMAPKVTQNIAKHSILDHLVFTFQFWTLHGAYLHSQKFKIAWYVY